MRRIIAIAAAMVSYTGFAIASQDDVSTIKTAEVSVSYDSGCVVYSLVLSRGDTDTTSITILDYNVFDYCQQLLIGKGNAQLPRSAFTGEQVGEPMSLSVNFTDLPHQEAALIANLTWVPNHDTATTQEWRRVTTDKLGDGTTRREVIVAPWYSNSADIIGTANIFSPDVLANGAASMAWGEILPPSARVAMERNE
jgi:hypothetical protein